MTKVGFLFEGQTTTDVLKQVWTTISKQGSEYKSQRGMIRSIKGATLVINDPLNESKNYPYWNKKEDDWYQNNFVRKETNVGCEKIGLSDIFPYKYVWRSRYYDSGLGYVKGTLDTFKKLGVGKVNFKTKSELVGMLKRSYMYYHPESILAVLAWKGSKLLNFYLENPKVLAQELASNRRDTLLFVINEIKQSPQSRRAITPSFTYEQIDHSGVAGGVPVYQNYQLYTEFSKSGKPVGLFSFHLHRAMDAMGGTQLDITHDREWGKIASAKLGLPLKKMVIYSNDIYYHVPEKSGHKDLVAKTSIRDWLFAVTDAYDPKKDDIEKRLASEIYQKKITLALKSV